MKQLLFYLLLFTTSFSFAQSGKYKTGIYFTGFYRDKFENNYPRVNKQIYVSPEITISLNKYFETGIGLIYQDLNRQFMRQSSIYDGVNYNDYKEWTGISTKKGGIKYINRANIHLSTKFILILGLDLNASLGRTRDILDPTHPVYLNGSLVKFGAEKNLISMGLYNYAGFSYPLNSRFNISAYTDIFNFKLDRLKNTSSKSTEIKGGFNALPDVDDAFYLKFGITCKI